MLGRMAPIMDEASWSACLLELTATCSWVSWVITLSAMSVMSEETMSTYSEASVSTLLA